MSPYERGELERIQGVALAYQHQLAAGLTGPAAFAVAERTAHQERVPLTYLYHLARAAATLRRQGEPVTPWSRVRLISGGEHVQVVDPLRVRIAGVGEVRGELFRLLCVDPRLMPEPLPGLAGVLHERAALSVVDAQRPGWPGDTPPNIRKAVICSVSRLEWVLFATIDVPEVSGLSPASKRTRAGLDIGVDPLAVLVREGRVAERMALDNPTVVELANYERGVQQWFVAKGLQARFASEALTWRQALYHRGLATLSPLIASLPGLQRLAVERLDLQQPTDQVTRLFSARARPFGLADVMAALPAWCQQSGTQLIRVDPSYSSQTCPECGADAIRRRSRLRCDRCGFAGDVHASAARVILQRGGR
ncbi:zinc ribbon domain-containing protein [Deinococcus altitudinis]|uniref:zinc ribbon domain-containing protein n=1 Tax=Deinococcus altitudinis TaxID=468914 RepID=UPI00389167DB